MMRQKNFLDPLDERLVAKVAAFIDELRPFEGERVADVEEAVADMLTHDASEADRRLRTELLRTFASSRPAELPPDIDPETIRVALYTEAWDGGLTAGLPLDDLFSVNPDDIVRTVAGRFAIDEQQFRRMMFADTPAERQIALPSGEHPGVSREAIVCLNVERLRQSMRRATRVSLHIPSRTQGDISYVDLLWGAKRLGLMYDIHESGSEVVLDVSGPYALFGRSTMYGNRLFEFVRLVLEHGGRHWRLSSDLLRGGGKAPEVLKTEVLDSSSRHFFTMSEHRSGGDMRSVDEEAFRRYFAKVESQWRLDYEGALIPLVDGTRKTLMVPDFFARRPDCPVEIFIEMVGFWKQEYLQRKIEKVRLLQGRHLILIVNAKLSTSREQWGLPETASTRVFFYSGREELKRVAEHVRAELQKIALAPVADDITC